MKLFVTFFLSFFSVIFCEAIPTARHKKSPSLSPITAQQLLEVTQKLRATNGLNCAFVFDLKTTRNRKTETKEGRFYSQQNSDGTNLRLDFGAQVFLSLGVSKDQIFCSEPSKKMTLNDPLQSDHLLTFSDILMPFLEKSAEYRHSKRVQGRNTHIIRFKEQGQIIDIAYDPAFEAILQVEYRDEKEKLLRTFKLLNFKKTQNMWLMKSIEIKDVSSDTTTQLVIKKVAVGQVIPPSIFDKNTLSKPPADNLVYTNF
ncbi:MAG: outer membrane lipoprotein-sorting protein [Puniceicoccales bacterium]|jgi:hypothetical protein|nr:outer membrane lipoprotein-sorting protein [Puniceicoccales bacterium]